MDESYVTYLQVLLMGNIIKILLGWDGRALGCEMD